MSTSKYSDGLQTRIAHNELAQKETYSKTCDCGICGHAIKKGARKDGKISPDTLWSTYEHTCITIFGKKYEGHKKTCSVCYWIVKDAVKEIPEEDCTRNLAQSAYLSFLEQKGNSLQSVLANEKIITDEVVVQSPSKKVELANVVEILKKHSSYGPPSKTPVKAKDIYTVLVGEDGVTSVKHPDNFKSHSEGAGRPRIDAPLVDLASNFMVDCGVSANKAGETKVEFEKTWIGVEGQSFSTQTALRCLVIKGCTADVIRAKWTPKQKSIWLGQDGGSAEGRHFIQSHLIGVDYQGNVTIMFLTLIETFGATTAPEIAQALIRVIDSIGTLQRSLKMDKIFSLLDIGGLVFDTTSENTGRFTGINAELEKYRKEFYDRLLKIYPNEKFAPYVKLVLMSCCDHVAQLILVYFFKNLVDTLKKWNATDCLAGDECVLQAMFDCFGNLLSGDEGRHIKSKIRDDIHEKIFETKLNVSFQNTDHTRYLSLSNLVEKFFEFETQITEHMETLMAANELTAPQLRYWLQWKTSTNLRIVAKLVVEAARDTMRSMMKLGNSTHSWLDWKGYLEGTLKKAADRKHFRDTKFSDEIISEFPKGDIKDKKRVQDFAKDVNKDLGTAIISILEKWYGDVITSIGNEERWVVCTNRHSERFMFILKLCIRKSKHMRLIVICAYMMLRHCKFSFRYDIIETLQIIYIDQGRNLYNTAPTRAIREKKVRYGRLEQLKVGIVKSTKMSRDDKILKFMDSCGFKVAPPVAKGKKAKTVKKPSLTIDAMQLFFSKLKEKKIFTHPVKQGSREKHMIIIENELIPQTSAKFTSVFAKK